MASRLSIDVYLWAVAPDGRAVDLHPQFGETVNVRVDGREVTVDVKNPTVRVQ
jgi:hypothetical protein